MSQAISRRMRISSRLIFTGFSLFTIYGILAAIFREQIAVYQYQSFSGADLRTLAEVTQYFAFDQVLLVGLMGAGLANATRSPLKLLAIQACSRRRYTCPPFSSLAAC